MLPRFPDMPVNPFWSADEDAIGRAVEAIVTWRARTADWFAGAERDEGISPALAGIVLEVLDVTTTRKHTRYPYRLTRFPAKIQGEMPRERLRELLLWRAGVVDFLLDVWDTLGPSDFTMEECGRLQRALTPESAQETCALCLGPNEPRHFDACAVQLAWREAPIGGG